MDSSTNQSLTSPLLQSDNGSYAVSESFISTDVTESTTISTLRNQLDDIQRQLANAISSSVHRKSRVAPSSDGGFVDVDFVTTKPKRSLKKLICCNKKGGADGKGVKTILHQFHAEFPEGCVTALMGPSGAGKTTLLDFLTGMLGKSVLAKGKVSLPNRDAYVPQDDRLHAFYTCVQYMNHYARLSGQKSLSQCCGSKNEAKRNLNKTDVIDDGNTENVSADEEGRGSITTSDYGGFELSEADGVDKLIDEILESVGLTKQKHTVVGGLFKRGLSGGQKRRLSVALEALSNPLNLFLDEPTSGLDSESALRLMEFLKSYANSIDPATRTKRRVILTIHQPSSHIWSLIDNVVLLSNGRLMYQGPRKAMDNFFAACGHPVPINYNPADHFIEALAEIPKKENFDEGTEESKGTEECENATALDNVDIPKMWNECFRLWDRSPEKDETTGPDRSSLLNQTVSFVVRADPRQRPSNTIAKATKSNGRISVELTRRYFVSLVKGPALALRAVIYGGISLILGILFFDLESDRSFHALMMSRTGLLYFLIAYCSSMSVAAVPFAIMERSIVQKEVRNHRYHPAFYHISQAITSIPACLLLAALVTVIVTNMTGIGQMGHFGVNLFLLFACAEATSMFVSHLSPDMVSALAIASGVFGIFTLAMGFLVAPSQFPKGLGWTYYVPFMTYSFRSLMYDEYSELTLHEGLDIPEEEEQYIISVSNCPTEDLTVGTQILCMFEMSDVNTSRDMIILAIWACAMHLLSVFYLHWTWYRNKRIFTYSD